MTYIMICVRVVKGNEDCAIVADWERHNIANCSTSRSATGFPEQHEKVGENKKYESLRRQPHKVPRQR